MFYWKSRGGSEQLDGLGDMSKTDILRGIITEKLSTAAREILAVVERTVADYEEEASGFRRQIERQSRQMELLQPQVKLLRGALAPDLQSHEVVVVNEDQEEQQEEQQQLTQQTAGVGDTDSLGLFWYDDDFYDEDEAEQLLVQPTTSSRQKREDLKDPDYEIPSRSFSPRVQSHRKRGRPSKDRTSDPQNHLDFRVRFLKDSQTEVLSNLVFRNSPVRDLRCPGGLQESDFLQLLRSTFPQLAAGEPFDLLITDNTRKLRPLQVKSLTPEEVFKSTGHSALYIRLKTAEDPQSSGAERPHPEDDTSAGAGQTEENTGSASGGDQTSKRRRGRPRIGEEPTHHFLRICLLEDSQADVVTEAALEKSAVQDLRCPRALPEAAFVKLLRSTFPQLADDHTKFRMFKSDRSRKLQRLRVKTLTPEEIYRSMRCTGIKKTFLYIKLKTGDDEEETAEEDKDELLSSEAVPMGSEAGLQSSAAGAVPARSSTSKRANPSADRSASEGDLSDDHDGNEAPEGDDDWKPDPDSQLPRRAKRRGPAAESRRTPCRVCGVAYRTPGSLIKHSWSHVAEAPAVCGVCGEGFPSSEELRAHLKNYQKTHDCSYCGKSFLTAVGLSNHTSMHTGNRPFKCGVCSKTFANTSALSIHRWIHVADRPHKCELCPKSFGLNAQLRAHRKSHAGRDGYHCNICGRSLYDLRSLTRHKLTHSGERRYGCEVCGKRFKLPSTLKAHQKIHTDRERPYLCHVCCKTFITNSTLTVHMKTHSGERPIVCGVCSKGFLSNGELKKHMRVHTGEAPYGCSECGRFFKLRSTLNSHVRSHLGIKRFTCGVCGKACSRQEHLTVHMRTHNGERPYKCSMCDKAFTQSHCLKTHLRSHQADGGSALEASTGGGSALDASTGGGSALEASTS